MNETGVIHLEIEKTGDWDNAVVKISATDNVKEDYGFLMTATEYLLNIACQRSPAGYEKAMELLNKGAMKYDSKRIG